MKDIVESVDVNSITFYPSYFKAIRRIPDDEIRLEAYDVICGYMMTGTTPENMSGQIESIFDGLKPNIDVSRINSKNGAKPKRTKNETVTSQKPNENETKTKAKQIEVEKEVEEEIEKESIKNTTRARTPSDARFNIFWQTYPKKVGKKAAYSAWKRAKITSDQFQDVIKAIEEQKESDQWKRGYIPNPATWLNQGRWDDEMPDSRAAPTDVLGEVFAEMERKEAVG